MREKILGFNELAQINRMEINAITTQYEPYSDFNFTSLFCWDTDNSAQFSNLNNNLAIKLPDYITGETVYSILGSNDIDESLSDLLKLTTELKLVPEVVIANIKYPKNYIITEDPDNFDYIYEVEKIAKLQGGALKKKRNKIHKFNAELGSNTSVHNTMTLTEKLKSEILTLFDRWVEENHEPTDLSGPERKAVVRLLDYSSHLNIIVTELRLDGTLVGFSINELLDHEYAICHFEKASLIHENIYTYLANQACVEIAKHNIKLVNWEQDLGLAGLKKSKISYNPVKLLKKYSVRTVN